MQPTATAIYSPGRVTHGRRDVITAVVRKHDGSLLLVKRSEKVGSYQGKWGAVSGIVEGDESLVERAHKEIEEEVGWTREQVQLVRSGRPLLVDDGDKHWAVHPFLFNARTDILPSLNWENVDAQFVAPTAVRCMPTVPKLAETVDRLLLSPHQETVLQRLTDDRTHGAAELAKQAILALKDESTAICNQDTDAAGGSAAERIQNFGYHLASCRPSMAAIANGVAMVLDDMRASLQKHGGGLGASKRDVQMALATAADHELDRLAEVGMRLQQQVIAHLSSGKDVTIMTLSYSSTICQALAAAAEAGRHMRVIVCESRPLCEGVTLANALAQHGVDVTLITEAQAALFMPGADMVLVGADAVSREGVVNKVGTAMLALAATAAEVPVLAAADSTKLSPGTLFSLAHPGGEGMQQEHEEKSALELQKAWEAPPSSGVEVRNVYFELVKAKHFAGIITEYGLCDVAGIAEKVQGLVQLYRRAFELE